MLLYALGVVLCFEARRRTIAGSRVARLLVVPALAGLLLIASLVVSFGSESRYLAHHVFDRTAGLLGLLAVLVTAIAFGDLFVTRLSAVAAWLLRPLLGRGRAGADLALVIGVVGPVVVALALSPRIEDRIPSGYGLGRVDPGADVAVRASYPLPGRPMDLEFRSGSGGYVSFGEGWIGRFELTGRTGAGSVQVTRVARGLDYPRGLAIVGDTLFVAELGPLPCTPAFPSCKGGDVDGRSIEQAERDILRTSRARILAYEIRADGSLAHRRVVMTDLPVANSDHGVNDIAPGPDGLLYVSIGNLDRLYGTTGLAPDLVRPHANLLGTVVTLRPDGSQLTVFARGLRNVYGLTFDRSGRLYGVDNDGLTRSGWRREELLQIRRGANYGYPDDGTFAPYPRQRDAPLWVVDAVGSGGIAWLAEAGGPGRLISGACSSVDSIRLTADGHDGVDIAERADVTRVLDLPGCVTTVKRQGNLLALGVFAFAGRSQLVLLDASNP